MFSLCFSIPGVLVIRSLCLILISFNSSMQFDHTFMGNTSEDDDSFTRPLGRWSIFYYGVGHMLNDITASCWFTYLLIFLTDIGLSPQYVFWNTHQIILIYNFVQDRLEFALELVVLMFASMCTCAFHL